MEGSVARKGWGKERMNFLCESYIGECMGEDEFFECDFIIKSSLKISYNLILSNYSKLKILFVSK